MNNLKKLRKEKHLTLRELGEICSISFTKLSSIETGKKPFTQEHIETLTKFFGVSSDYLLGNIPSDTDPIFVLYKNDKYFSEAETKEIMDFAEFLKSKRK